MSSTISPNMNLIVPVVGQEPGPQYATDVNNSLGIIDGHDHSSGSGVQVTPAGLNISSDLSFQGNNGINFRSVRFTAQNAPLGTASDLGCLYESGVDLYYNDGLGNQVRLTQSGAVAGTPGSIANLTSPASATYVAANQTFVWQSDANTPANMDAASYIFRNLSAGSFGLTLNPPAAMPANFSLTLPSLPASQKIMTLDNTGAMSAPYVVDNSTIEIATNTIQVKDLGITTAKLAAQAVTAAKIANATITTTQIAANTIVAGNIANNTITAVQQATPSQGSTAYTTASTTNTLYVALVSVNYTVAANSLGRPIYIYCAGDNSGGHSGNIAFPAAGGSMLLQETLNSGGTQITVTDSPTSGGPFFFPASSMSGFYTPLATTGTFTLSLRVLSTGTANVSGISLRWVQL